MERNVMRTNASYERFSLHDRTGNSGLQAPAASGWKGGPDQRRSPRKPVFTELALGQCVTCFGKWSTRNLSLHGTYLDGVPKPVPVGTVVDVAFRYAAAGASVMRYVPARVVRVESGGMALDFGRYGRAVRDGLVALMRFL